MSLSICNFSANNNGLKIFHPYGTMILKKKLCRQFDILKFVNYWKRRKLVLLEKGIRVMKKSVFKDDLYRYYGERGESIKKRIFRPIEIKYLCALRKAQGSSNFITKTFYKLKLRRLSLKSHIQIHAVTKIGKGFFIGHSGRIIINPEAVLGENINIATGVTIGQENRGERKGAPTIGNNCWIGTNAVIVGNIKIGSDVLIAPLSFVNFDVPDHSIVVGNPAKVIHRENATEAYIDNAVHS